LSVFDEVAGVAAYYAKKLLNYAVF